MRFFLDTANVEDIKKANDLGVICGVTTNPSLIAKEGHDFKETVKEIASKSTFAVVVTSPAIRIRPVLTTVSQATWAVLSCFRIASRIASEIWSQILSGCPSETDSEVNNLDII